MPNKIKNNGQVYTPDFLVSNILDYVGYCDAEIIGKHVIDNSCGDGAFICEIIKRYCAASTVSAAETKHQLETFVHGIEIDKEQYGKCLTNASATAAMYGIENVDWDILCGDALKISQFDGRMDYVVGNPPYVRIHNLDSNYEAVKKYRFTQNGMTDLYIAFFEIGFHMMKPDGKMCIITSGSWLTSSAGKILRSQLLNDRTLTGIIDLEHYQPFDATTYTVISRFDNKGGSHNVEYCTYNSEIHSKSYMCSLALDDIAIDGNFYLSAPESLKSLRKIKSTPNNHTVIVKNGFATLADKVFIGELPFQKHKIRVIKASTGQWHECFYPYDRNGRPLEWDTLTNDSMLIDYLECHKDKLQNGRDNENKEKWWLFGRSQAISDVYRKKIAVSSLVKDINSIKINQVNAGEGVFGGLYLTVADDVGFETIKAIIVNEDFIEYIKILKNYKSGGYYTFSSKDLSQYLNYKLECYGHDVK